MAIKASEITAYSAYHPGELLKEEMEYRNINTSVFSEQFGIAPGVLDNVLKGNKDVTAELALTMEAALGINADMLVRMQSDYELYQSRHNKSFLAKLENIKRIAASVLI